MYQTLMIPSHWQVMHIPTRQPPIGPDLFQSLTVHTDTPRTLDEEPLQVAEQPSTLTVNVAGEFVQARTRSFLGVNTEELSMVYNAAGVGAVDVIRKPTLGAMYRVRETCRFLFASMRGEQLPIAAEITAAHTAHVNRSNESRRFAWEQWCEPERLDNFLLDQMEVHPDMRYLYDSLSRLSSITELSYNEVRTHVIRDLDRQGEASGAPFRIVEAHHQERIVERSGDHDQTFKSSNELVMNESSGTKAKDDDGHTSRKGARAAAAMQAEAEPESGPSNATQHASRKATTTQFEDDLDSNKTNTRDTTRTQFERKLDVLQVSKDMQRFLTTDTGKLAPFCKAFRAWTSPGV